MGSTGLVAAVLVSGAIAGAVFGAVTHVLAVPYIEEATLAEARGAAGAGAGEAYWDGYYGYREWQGGGAVTASVVLGVAFAALYGVVYLAYGHRLPGRGEAARACVLAGAMWLALYAVPAIKYPPALPGEGSAETLGARLGMHALLVAVSGASAIALHRASLGARWPRAALYPAAWALVVVAAWAALPDSAAPAAEGAWGFRAASAVSVAAYWAALPAAFVPLVRLLGGRSRPARFK